MQELGGLQSEHDRPHKAVADSGGGCDLACGDELARVASSECRDVQHDVDDVGIVEQRGRSTSPRLVGPVTHTV